MTLDGQARAIVEGVNRLLEGMRRDGYHVVDCHSCGRLLLESDAHGRDYMFDDGLRSVEVCAMCCIEDRNGHWPSYEDVCSVCGPSMHQVWHGAVYHT